MATMLGEHKGTAGLGRVQGHLSACASMPRPVTRWVVVFRTLLATCMWAVGSSIVLQPGSAIVMRPLRHVATLLVLSWCKSRGFDVA